MRKVTQQDIADTLGISRLTVSKGLNGAQGVSEQMRQMIMQKALELGYREPYYALTDQQQQQVKRLENKCVSLLTFQGGEVGTFWAQVINGIVSGLEAYGLELNICLISSYTKDNFRVPTNFSANSSQGIITMGNFTKEHILKIKDFGLPVISLDTVSSADDYRPLVDTVLMCNEQPITEIVSYLVRNGHRKIGYVGKISSNRSFFERWMGFKRGMERGGLEIDPELCLITEGIEPMATETVRRGIATQKRLPTAYVCANDSIAMGVVQTLRDRGLRVPEDIAVSGFDNAYESNLLNLTTVDSFMVELGQRAAAEFMARLHFPNHPYISLHMATKVILRGSTNRKITAAE